jgi:hypothetical protein
MGASRNSTVWSGITIECEGEIEEEHGSVNSATILNSISTGRDDYR